jgi:3-hydroxyisobutyrate dehydrogenase-like beta-hydroxyacid dehydrogenase
MARQIIDAGFPTTLWARRPESLAPYASTAARTAVTLKELGTRSDILGVCVVNDADVDQVLRGDEGALVGMAPGGIVIVHSTVHPDTCRRLAADHPELTFLDAPVSGGGHTASTKSLLVMVGGDRAALERCRAVLETFAGTLVHLGVLGSAQEAKLLNNALFTAHLGLAADLFKVGRDRGLDPAAFGTLLLAGSGRSYGLEVLAGAGHALDGLAQLVGPLLAKDVKILIELIGSDQSRTIDVATETIQAMNLNLTEDAHVQ